MYALVLEGGGARGAYQAGALKAFFEAGYRFNIVVGTSIGAINGAMIAQNDFEIMYKLWKDLNFSDILDIDDKKIERLFKKNIDIEILKYISEKLSTTFKNKGISTRKIREFLEANINEQKLRESDIDFGLVTYSLTDKKPIEIFLKDIQKGEIINYLLASSRLPIFRSEAINDKYYIDGGVYNNCPLDMIDPYKYQNIVVICTKPTTKIKGLEKIKKAGAKLTIIKPSQELTRIINFQNKAVNSMISLGYYDTLKYLEKLDGIKYYIKPLDETYFFNILVSLNKEQVTKIAEFSDIKQGSSHLKLLFEKIIPGLTAKIDRKKTKSYKEAVIALLEYIANLENIDKFQVYTFDGLIKKVYQKMRLKDKSNTDKAICTFIKCIYQNEEEK